MVEKFANNSSNISAFNRTNASKCLLRLHSKVLISHVPQELSLPTSTTNDNYLYCEDIDIDTVMLAKVLLSDNHSCYIYMYICKYLRFTEY